MQQYFDRIAMFVNEPELPQRIRFMIQDIIELRQDKWVPRKAVASEGPLPIHEVYIISIIDIIIHFFFFLIFVDNLVKTYI